MTKQEMEHVRLLRKNGYSYGQIADYMGIPINTIRSYCNRKHIQVGEYKEIRFCKNCGKTLEGSQEKFCSRKCKTDWWNHHPKQQKGQIEKTCACCGKTFFSYPFQNRKYCSHPCYIKERFTCNSRPTE